MTKNEPITVKAEAMPSAPSVSASAPPGMMSKSVTTTYPDGRQVTTTEFLPAAAAMASSAPPSMQTAVAHSMAPFSCQSCSQPASTRVSKEFGTCTWISVIILILFCFPLFWVPFVCPDVSQNSCTILFENCDMLNIIIYSHHYPFLFETFVP